MQLVGGGALSARQDAVNFFESLRRIRNYFPVSA